jgi:hypothetical protein
MNTLIDSVVLRFGRVVEESQRRLPTYRQRSNVKTEEGVRGLDRHYPLFFFRALVPRRSG